LARALKYGQEGHVFVREMERWLLGLPSVGKQPSDKIDDKVGPAAMTGMFNLRDIFELVSDGDEEKIEQEVTAATRPRRKQR